MSNISAAAAAIITDETRRQANLRLLQRTCSAAIVDIVVSATHVVLYEYKDAAWYKSGIEGSLFCAVNNAAAYELIIVNRHSPDNFQIGLTTAFQVQHQDPYLIFKQTTDDTPRIRGIWFHNADERAAVFAVLQRTLQTIEQQQQQATSDAAATLGSLFSPMSVSSSTGASDHVAPTACLAESVEPSAVASPARASASLPPDGVALDKKSLQLALLSLIQDDRFLDLLHSQYIRVVHKRLGANKNAPRNQPPSSDGSNDKRSKSNHFIPDNVVKALRAAGGADGGKFVGMLFAGRDIKEKEASGGGSKPAK
jgi:mRNA-decapping enzyme 1B